MHRFLSVYSSAKVILRFNIQINNIPVILDVASDFMRFVIRLEIMTPWLTVVYLFIPDCSLKPQRFSLEAVNNS